MSLQARFGLVVALVGALGLAACEGGTTAAGGVTRVVSTTSFGMCVGYCTTKLEITEGGAVLVRESRGGRGAVELPTQTFKSPLTAGEWQEVVRLAGAAKFDGLPAVIGCPDCADGGAESLTVEGAGAAKTVSFDHGAKVDGLQPLLDRVRDLREKLTPKEP
ncbi:MAG: hypothetical protein KBA31_06215 [Alphaproteobacteria bacterium]|nr:hypothetical protein [Alphaproteobacteria bacterium]